MSRKTKSLWHPDDLDRVWASVSDNAHRMKSFWQFLQKPSQMGAFSEAFRHQVLTAYSEQLKSWPEYFGLSVLDSLPNSDTAWEVCDRCADKSLMVVSEALEADGPDALYRVVLSAARSLVRAEELLAARMLSALTQMSDIQENQIWRHHMDFSLENLEYAINSLPFHYPRHGHRVDIKSYILVVPFELADKAQKAVDSMKHQWNFDVRVSANPYLSVTNYRHREHTWYVMGDHFRYAPTAELIHDQNTNALKVHDLGWGVDRQGMEFGLVSKFSNHVGGRFLTYDLVRVCVAGATL